MSEIKLEVGKTYRNREGKEVGIVEKYNTAEYPFRGSDLYSYTESGRFYLCKETEHDLIAEVPSEPRYAFTIPGGVTKLTVEQVSNRIIVEMVPEAKVPKPGDDAAERCRIMDFLQGYANNVKWSHEQLCWMIEGYLSRKKFEKWKHS